VFAVSWRAVTAYLLGGLLDLGIPGLGFWVGFKFSRSHSPLVRFHAVQACSLSILYLILFFIVHVPPAPQSYSLNDVILYLPLTVIVIRLLLAVMVIRGRNLRLPVLWKLAAVIAAQSRA
jgi:uncharacterized membrane protein